VRAADRTRPFGLEDAALIGLAVAVNLCEVWFAFFGRRECVLGNCSTWSFAVFGRLRRQVEGVLEGFAGFRANTTENPEAQAALRLTASEPLNFSFQADVTAKG